MLLWGILLSSTAVFSTMPFVPAQDEGDRTTASEVVDRETLKKFVESARDHILSLADVNQWAAFAAEMREEGGDWRDGNMYLVILTPSGTVWRHGTDAKLEGIDVSDVMDDDGAAVVQKILTAGQMEGGGFVEYTWDDPSDPDDTNPKVCYVVQYASPLNQRDLLLVGGYYQDISEVSTDIGEFPDPPSVTAGDVVDRETLKAFVRGTIAWALEGFATFGLELNQLLDEARREGGPWKMGSTYLYALTEEGFVIMHAARPDQQGKIQIDREDRNGFKFVKALIDAANSGGGYVEYYWDDPLVIGDEDLGSAKIGYAELMPGSPVVVGSGFYKGNQMALDFAHFGNGNSFSSDVVLVNLAATPIQPLVYFYGKDGDLIDPESMVDVRGNLETTEFGALTLQSELPSRGEITISTNGMGDFTTGSVKVVTEGLDSPIGGVLRFDAPGVGVAGAGASQAVRDAIIPVRRQMGGIDTGAAFRNLSESELTLTCRLMMGGEMVEMQTVTLPANGQTAMFISELFEHDTSDFAGSLRCTAPAGEQEFTGVAAEMDANNRIFTTLPVIPLSGDVSSDGTATAPSPAGGVVVAGADATLGDDDYVLNSATITGDKLTVSVSYSGGCRTHVFTLVIAASFVEGSPVRLPAVLRHDGNGDTCEAFPTESRVFDLALVRSRYREVYGPGAGRVALQLEGAPENGLIYEFTE